jgi:hypothetical protein
VHSVRTTQEFYLMILRFACALLFTATILPEAIATEIETVQEIIAIHQRDARTMLGQEIALKIYTTNEPPNPTEVQTVVLCSLTTARFFI